MEATALDLRRAGRRLRDAALALNAGAEVETGPLDAQRLDAMLGAATVAEALTASDGDVLAFLIAFDQDARYDGANFRWFRARLPRFVYVDRVIVASAARGRGLARALYLRLFERARVLDLPEVVCEVNIRPPNPGSDAFHAALGFVEAGATDLPGGKRVRYLRRGFAEQDIPAPLALER